MAKNVRKTASNPTPKRAIDDNYVAPKRKQVKHTTLQEALAESGETIEELTQTIPAEADRPVRPAGTSNLANTIRSHRGNYNPMLHPNGKKTQNNGDEIAVLLLSIPMNVLKAYAAMKFDGKSYDHLNPGHARMCIGNLIRAAARKDPSVLEALRDAQPKVEA